MSEIRVTDAELAVLNVLWDVDAATKRELAERLYPPLTDSALATVQKLLERLERKGLVTRDRNAFAHVIRATMSKSAFAGLYLEQTARKLSAGSLAPLLIQLVENQPLNADDRARLRAFLDNVDEQE